MILHIFRLGRARTARVLGLLAAGTVLAGEGTLP